MNDQRRPWPSLLAFREADKARFGGRDEQIDALFRRIAADRLTLLFGLSGLGKTSLLLAGLFPRLRGEHYFPVYIRLGYGSDDPPPVEQIKRAIVEQAATSRVEAPEPLPEETLWEYFRRAGAGFWDERNYPALPVLVFDQFEELFTKGGSDPALVDQLSDLAERTSPAGERYRLVFAIRSDYLADLERISDRVRAIFSNRYQLKQMSGEAALASTIKAGGDLIEESVAQYIVRFVAAAPEGDSSSVEGLRVDPALLSLICSELNERRIERDEPRITATMLSGSKDEILARFYMTSLAGVAPELRELIEDKLVTRDGTARNFISAQTAYETPGVTKEDVARLVERRLLRFEGSGDSLRLELTHDRLTGVAAASRREREKTRQLAEAERRVAATQRALRRNRRLAILFLVLLIAAVAGPFIIRRWTLIGAQRVEADSAFRLAMQKLESDEPSEGLAYLARVVRLDPRNRAARTLLFDHVAHRPWPVPLRSFGPTAPIKAAAISRDGAYAVFYTEETVEMWDVARGQRIGSIAPTEYEPRAAFASDDRTAILERIHLGYDGRIWNPFDKRLLTLQELTTRVGSDHNLLRAFDFSREGDLIAFQDHDGISIRSFASDLFEHVAFPEELGQVASVRFSPDARFVVVTGRAGLIMYDRQRRRVTGKGVVEFPELIAFTADGEQALTLSDSRLKVDVWDLASGVATAGFKPSSPVARTAMTRDGAFIMTWGDDRVVSLLTMYGTPVREPFYQLEPLADACFSADGTRLLLVTDRSIRLRSVETAEPAGEPLLDSKGFVAAGFVDGGRNLLTISRSSAHVWHVPPAVPLPLVAADVQSPWMRASRETLVVNDGDTLAVFDAVTKRPLWRRGILPRDAMRLLVVDPAGSRVLSYDATDRTLRLVEGATRKALWSRSMTVPVKAANFSADGTAILLTVEDVDPETSRVPLTVAWVVYDASNGEPLGPVIPPEQGVIRGLSRNGTLMLMQSDRGAVVLWDVKRHEPITTIRQAGVNTVKLSADGDLIAAASRKGGIRVWGAPDGREIAASADGGDLLTFSPDGRDLVVATNDAVEIRDTRTLNRRSEPIAVSAVRDPEFSADSRRLLIRDNDGVQMWDVASGRPLSRRRSSGAATLLPDGSSLFLYDKVSTIRQLPLPTLPPADGEPLADLAEALAGVRVTNLGVTQPVDGRPVIDRLAKGCAGRRDALCEVVLRVAAAR
ncbi:MAG TPA: WD40 repeat domain-containing protein [Thermoanaerobaculia bacterium]|nr:WD40 repeat domain-containing protein [Thermoanaerobaculia bacterium]